MRRWCLQPWCTLDGNWEYWTALRALGDFYADLAALMAPDLEALPNWQNALHIALIDTWPSRLDAWDSLLAAWLPQIPGHPRFADGVLFHVVRHMPIKTLSAQAWVSSCAALAAEVADESLVESLLIVLGPATTSYPDLASVALRISACSSKVTRVLGLAGLAPDKNRLQHEARLAKDAQRATRNIYAAIRQNDTLGVSALLKKKPDLTARLREDKTALEYAQSLGRTEIARLIEGAAIDR